MAEETARTERYPAMEMAQANEQCGPRPNMQYRATCPKCDSAVILHCRNCNIQVTGCLCTEVDRFGSSVALERLMQRVGYEQAVARMTKAGFYIPPSAQN